MTSLRVSTHDVRSLRPDELRAASDLFMAALLGRPVPDADWERVLASHEPGRALGAHADGELVGTSVSFTAGIVVPGGPELPTAAVTGVGVRADRTRQGVLSALMRHQLTERAAAGDVLAALRATEARIYGRFGYGIASSRVHSLVDSRMSGYVPGIRIGGGRVRRLSTEAARPALRAA